MTERTVEHLAGWILVIAVAYVSWHLWLRATDQTPDQFVAHVRELVQSIGLP